MNRWSEIDDDGETTRKVGPLTLRAHCYGQISISMDTIYDHEAHLVPAQAAADAACERLLREALADFGLVFVRTTGDPDYPNSLVALSHDGVLLYIVDRTSVLYQFGTIDPFRGDLVGWYVGKFATESEAIAAARAHDEQRRGGR